MDNNKLPCEGNPRSIRVLMYHRVVNNRALSRKYWSCLHIDDFRKQLELLDRWGFTPITFNDYRLFLQKELNLPRKPVVLTFDDGYLDTYEIAYPIMQEYGVRAVLFVLGDQKIRTNFWDRHLDLPEAPLMDRHHIVELHEAGFEIGSHSLTHAKLTMLSEDGVWEQISRSRILLEILLNAPVLSFCYPYGMVNPMIKKMVSYAGFDLACSVASGPASFGDDVYEIRRTTVCNNTGSLGFALRLLTPFHYYGWTRWKASHAFHGKPKASIRDKSLTQRWSQFESLRK